jgi:Pyruvate/2-oxoacid:ferredoxin oxidoreductase delta subunit
MNSASKSLRDKIDELLKVTYVAISDLSKCKSCGTCVRFCPWKIRIFNSEGKAITIKTDKSCGGCSVCFKRCPHHAVKLISIQKK